jgi:hypothetical protein
MKTLVNSVVAILVGTVLCVIPASRADQLPATGTLTRSAIIIVSGHSSYNPRPVQPTPPLPIRAGNQVGLDPALAVSLNPQPLPPKIPLVQNQ